MSFQQDCLICERNRKTADEGNPHLIHEFEHTFFVVGDHQFHKGYCLLLLKEHVREVHELDPAVQIAFFQEIMTATLAIVKTFKPWKINHSCYGNLVEHVHWHIFPRYDTQPDYRNHPWVHAAEFDDHKIDAISARSLASQIRQNLILAS